ncbi:MAG: molecular chaperone DnaK [Candidatus Colwellbacteria bacterium]|jgi:molecular chaperone DnaK|nr:molecular chaperone DnaK [Candidatus Colwellbacteria bacterium]MDD3752461.1 molecular chaperone DnaK [Candidatus Colwellbacteria bacterium]
MSKIIGIDLGTTNSAMAFVGTDGKPEIIESAEGARTTPSVVALSKSDERLVGVLAKRQSITNPANTISSVKRLIGRKWDDSEVQNDKEWAPYEIRKSENGGIDIKMGDKWYKPEEISAMVLSKLRADAEMRLGERIEEAVITVPAYFDDSQRQATKNAGEIAGLKVKRILNEPTAAALAYGLNKEKNEKIVVYDFGGGTFDISVLEVGDDTVEVKATGGDTYLGGDDFDKKLNEYVVAKYKEEEGIDISKDPLALQRLKEAVERAKHELSSSIETEINLPYITSDSSGPKHLLLKVTRAKLEELVSEYIEKAAKLTEETVKEAGFSLSDINEIILVGGQTRMPAIQASVKKLFGKEPNRGINPDEVVALGAAIQGGIFQGDVKDILLLDVTPLTLSIETLGGIATPMIPKNTTVPTAKTQIFSTAADNQPSVEVHVLQGERPMAADNKTLARFILDGIPPSPRGVPQVEVSFDIDANGILNVKAIDKATGKSQSVKIEAQTSLSKEEIERLKNEAAVHADSDKKKKDLIEAKNQGEALAYSAEKAVKDAGDKLDSSIKSEVEEKISTLRSALGSEEKEKIDSASEDLSASLQKIGESLYNEGKEPEQNNEENKGGENKGEGGKEGKEE